MADGQAPTMTAPFPDPPPYAKHFTKDNLNQLRDFRQTHGAEDDTALPEALRNLVPPSPPSDGKYRSFGISHDLSQPDLSLAEAGITQLYPSTPRSTDPTTKLIALTRAIILNYLELVGILSLNAEETGEKVEDLQTLFYNVHDLINQYRPHQARESLIVLMEEQLAKAKGEIEAVQASKVKLTELLKGVQERGQEQEKIIADSAADSRSRKGKAQGGATGPDEKREMLQRRQWAALDAEFG